MKKLYLALREAIWHLKDPYYSIKKEQRERVERFSILERLSAMYGAIGKIPLEVFEKEAGIIKTRDDLIPKFLYSSLIL